MIWFTSDLHLGHNKDFVVQARGFETIEEMNAEIIRRWNERISADDDVYVLGDLILGDVDAGIALIATLNGKLHIMRGNHDTDKKVEKYLELPNIVEVKYADILQYGKAVFWMSHYPTITANYDDDKPWAKHLINLFGHTHQKAKFYNDIPFMFHVGMDSNNNTPILLDDIIEMCNQKVVECKEML